MPVIILGFHAVNNTGTRMVIVGLSDEEEDELYANLEAKYGSIPLSALTGTPYILQVEGVKPMPLYECVKSFCEEKGHKTQVDE